MYEKGAHGLALANKLTETNDGRAVQEECTSWIRLAHTWLESLLQEMWKTDCTHRAENGKNSNKRK